jgi:hypothetical protein
LQNKKILYDLLLQTKAETLLEVARDPKHLGSEIRLFIIPVHMSAWGKLRPIP